MLTARDGWSEKAAGIDGGGDGWFPAAFTVRDPDGAITMQQFRAGPKADPLSDMRVEEDRHIYEQLQKLGAEILHEPLPERLLDLLENYPGDQTRAIAHTTE